MSLERARQAALVQAALRGDEHAREPGGVGRAGRGIFAPLFLPARTAVLWGRCERGVGGHRIRRGGEMPGKAGPVSGGKSSVHHLGLWVREECPSEPPQEEGTPRSDLGGSAEGSECMVA